MKKTALSALKLVLLAAAALGLLTLGSLHASARADALADSALTKKTWAPQAPSSDILNAVGKVNYLRVNDVGDWYGSMQVEVVIHLSTMPGKAFGFTLRDDPQRAAHQAMLDLLRDAYRNEWIIAIDYETTPAPNDNILFRLWLTK